jgi:hypothetical protein
VGCRQDVDDVSDPITPGQQLVGNRLGADLEVIMGVPGADVFRGAYQ